MLLCCSGRQSYSCSEKPLMPMPLWLIRSITSKPSTASVICCQLINTYLLVFCSVQALKGHGIDRHLLGLKLQAIEEGLSIPKIFMDTAYGLATHWKLRTGQVCFCASKCASLVVRDLLYRRHWRSWSTTGSGNFVLVWISKWEFSISSLPVVLEHVMVS